MNAPATTEAGAPPTAQGLQRPRLRYARVDGVAAARKLAGACSGRPTSGTSPPNPFHPSAADATQPYKAATPLDPEAACVCVCVRCIRRLHNAPDEPPLLAGPIEAARSLSTLSTAAAAAAGA
ncbi:hypothetical protein MTO96_013741 [Rhipicephalus appendiculatus]